MGEGEEKKKRKLKEYKRLRTKITCTYFYLTNKKKTPQTHNALFDDGFIAHDPMESSPCSWTGLGVHVL